MDLPDAHCELLLAVIETGPIGVVILRTALELRELRRGVHTGKVVVSKDGKHVTVIEERKFTDSDRE